MEPSFSKQIGVDKFAPAENFHINNISSDAVNESFNIKKGSVTNSLESWIEGTRVSGSSVGQLM